VRRVITGPQTEERPNYVATAYTGDNAQAICAAVNTIDALVKLARCVQAEEAALASDDPAEYHKHPAFYAQVRQALTDLDACIAAALGDGHE
jgi:hypothetical protein